MKKALFIVAITMMLAGCSAATKADAPAPAPVAQTTPDDTVVAPAPSSDQAMLAAIRSMSPDFNSVDDQLIIDTVNNICDAFAQGYSGSDVIAISAGNIGTDNATTLIAAAVVVKCPQYEAQAKQ